MTKRLAASLAAAFVGLGVLADGQEKTPQKPPVFRSGIDVVELDVSVLDKTRRPVPGLTAADFTILEDGVPQAISVFDSFVVSARPPRPAWATRFGPDVSSNKLEDTRLFVIVFDDACLPGDQQVMVAAKQAVRDIVERLPPTDLAALVFTASSKSSQDFTADKTKLLAAVDRVNHGLACGSEVRSSAVQVLGRVAETLAAVPHRRKVMLWISGGVPVDFALRPVWAPTPAGASVGSSGSTEVDVRVARSAESRHVADIAKDMLASLQRSNVTVYGIDPSGLLGDRNKEALDFLITTSRSTGGRVVTNINDLAAGIEQIFDENSAYYMLGFTSSNRRPGSLRHITVKVNRPDLEVRTRSEYYAAVESVDQKKPSVLERAIADVLPNPDLPMDVAIAAFVDAGSTKAVVTVACSVTQPIPPRPGDARITEKTELQISAFSPEGEPRATQRSSAKVVIRPGATGVFQWEALGRIALPSGRYRLRLAAYSDTANKAGSVYTDVEVPDFTRMPFSVSGVVINAVPTRPFAPKDIFSELLPLTPTAAREFEPTDRVTAFFQVYESINLGGGLPLKIRVLDEKNQIRVDESQVIGIGQFLRVEAPYKLDTEVNGRPTSAKIQSADIRYQLPLSRLGPGEYVVIFEITQSKTIETRHVRFTVKAAR